MKPQNFPGTGVELLSINANCAVQKNSFVLEIAVVLKNSALILMRA